jgi:hypothetical protein
MPKARLAERILSLVVMRDRAASIVGDLVEASPGGRTPWISVARIGVSLLWKDVSARPGRMLYLATGGIVMNLAFLAPLGAAFFFLAIVLGLLGALLHRDVTMAVDPLFACLVICAAVPAPFMTGRWMARRSQGKELAPCLALTILGFASWGACCLAYGERVTLMNGLSGILPSLACLTVAAFSLNAGAIWSRNHAESVWRWFERVPFEENWARRKSLWDVCIPADLEQQKICDWSLLMALPLLFVGLPAIAGSADTAMRVALVPSYLFQAIATRPLQWMRPSSRLVALVGRLLFLALAILAALTSYWALRRNL